MNTKSYILTPKKYHYDAKFLGLNAGVHFLESQINELKKLKVGLLLQYKNSLEKYATKNQDANIMIVSNDIDKFLLEYNESKNKLFKLHKRLYKGTYGENKIKEIVYTLNDEWGVLQDASLVYEGNKIENDFLLVGRTGIITIEVKNIGTKSDNLYIDNLGRVNIVSHKKNKNLDMIAQGNRHLAYLRKFIKTSSIPFEVPIYSVIVIASSIRIFNKSSFTIIGPNQIENTLVKFPISLSIYEKDIVYKKLLNSIVESNKYQYMDYYNTLQKNYMLILKSLKEILLINQN